MPICRLLDTDDSATLIYLWTLPRAVSVEVILEENEATTRVFQASTSRFGFIVDLSNVEEFRSDARKAHGEARMERAAATQKWLAGQAVLAKTYFQKGLITASRWALDHQYRIAFVESIDEGIVFCTRCIRGESIPSSGPIR